MVMWVTIIGIGSFIAAIIAAFVARYKNRSANSWFASTFLFAPSLIVLLFLGKSKTGPFKPDDDEDKDMRELWSD